jgi:hypothetical protein
MFSWYAAYLSTGTALTFIYKQCVLSHIGQTSEACSKDDVE